MTRPGPPCSPGAFRCGDAFIDGYGLADWQFFIVGFVPISNACGEYVANTTFTLADDSSLTLAETGTVCGPGNSFFNTPGFSWGNPDSASATWEVLGGTGQFAAVTGGSGTDELQSAGARVRGTYVGILQD